MRKVFATLNSSCPYLLEVTGHSSRCILGQSKACGPRLTWLCGPFASLLAQWRGRADTMIRLKGGRPGMGARRQKEEDVQPSAKNVQVRLRLVYTGSH